MPIKVIDEVKDFLTREDAEEYVKKVPDSLDSRQLNEYDIIVAMEPKHKKAILSRCPECQSKIVVWDIDDPIKLPPGYDEKVFNQIRQKVKELAKSL